jgi:hypothetical protein
MVNATTEKDDHTEKLILTIVKSMQPITDDDIHLEFNEISEEELSFKELKDRLKSMKQLEKIGETFVDFDPKEIWQVKEE